MSDAVFTFADLERLEPRLTELAAAARRFRDLPRHEAFCANAVWYGYDELRQGRRGSDRQSLKARMCRLVGFEALGTSPILATCQAYDVAYKHLYALLPDCRHEGMCR